MASLDSEAVVPSGEPETDPAKWPNPQEPSIGRIVHFVMPDGQHRAAIICRVWANDTHGVQLQVFTDGSNDVIILNASELTEVESNGYKYKVAPMVVWRTSVPYCHEQANKPYTYHWPERV